jgi:hypothetical protein
VVVPCCVGSVLTCCTGRDAPGVRLGGWEWRWPDIVCVGMKCLMLRTVCVIVGRDILLGLWDVGDVGCRVMLMVWLPRGDPQIIYIELELYIV